MKKRFPSLFIFYLILFLFYPGNSIYLEIFSHKRNLFEKQNEKKIKLTLNPLPHLRDPNLLPEIKAQGVYVVDLNSFTPIYQKNPQMKFIPASTTKIITAMVAYEIYRPEMVIKVNQMFPFGQIMNLQQGERLTVENLLYGLLVHSANDAAYVLAHNFGYQKFVDLMNKKTKEIKMMKTNFTDPAGLEEKNQYTTPFDLALAAREFLKNKYLSKIVATKEIVISDVEFRYFHRLSNINQLLGEVAGIGGLKTGYTENARENLVSFFVKDNKKFIIVILKSEDRFDDTKKVINWLQENLSYLRLDPL
ncbi:MAG: D-alanyl-D-alanine carboxypeptidase [Patescibacteria group bacterium]|nr:D-alanyl-D-alanine carboxypeptidase [Patescibacteria group bacterium]